MWQRVVVVGWLALTLRVQYKSNLVAEFSAFSHWRSTFKDTHSPSSVRKDLKPLSTVSKTGAGTVAQVKDFFQIII